MNLISKGYKFLQELDEPSAGATSTRDGQEAGAQTLEASLEDAAGRFLGWAGAAAQQLPVLGNSGSSMSQSTTFGDGDHFESEALDYSQAECDVQDGGAARFSEIPNGPIGEDTPTLSEGQAAEEGALSQVTETWTRAKEDDTSGKFDGLETAAGALQPQAADETAVASVAPPALECNFIGDNDEDRSPPAVESRMGITKLAVADETVARTAPVPVLEAAPEAKVAGVATEAEGEGSAIRALMAGSTVQEGGNDKVENQDVSTVGDAATESIALTPEVGQPPEGVHCIDNNCDALVRQLADLQEELDDTKELLRQREQQLEGLTQHLAEREADHDPLQAERAAQAKVAAEKETASARELVKAAQQTRDEAVQRAAAVEKRHKQECYALEQKLAKSHAAQEEALQRAVMAERRLKEDIADTERELQQHQGRWREKIVSAERQAAANATERDEACAEVVRLQTELESRAKNEGDAVKVLEAGRAKVQHEYEKARERLQAAVEVEDHLRREISGHELARHRLEERCSELEGQLTQVQAAYSEATAEMGVMSTRLHELEFGSNTETGAEDVLRRELAVIRERSAELEKRLDESTWMRDYALKQAEEARGHLDEQRAQLAQLAAGAVGSSSSGEAEKEVEKLKVQLQQLEVQEVEFKKQAMVSREEVEYFKRKCDEKDKRLEVLTCERNALRFESQESQAKKPVAGTQDDELPPLEDGLGRQNRATALEEHGVATGAVVTWMADTDRLMRRFSRTLYMSPTTRRTFYGYFSLLHVWIWVVLHYTATVHAPHGT